MALGRKFSFPHFFQPCFTEFHWNLVDSFSMNSYRSSSTFVPVDLFLQELWPISWSEIQFLVGNLVFRTFLSHASLNFIETWQMALVWVVTGHIRLSFRLTHFCKSYGPFLGLKFSFPHFSQPCFTEFHWNLADTFSMSSYRSSSTFIPVDPFLQELWPISLLEIQFSALFSAMLHWISLKLSRYL